MLARVMWWALSNVLPARSPIVSADLRGQNSAIDGVNKAVLVGLWIPSSTEMHRSARN